VKGKVSSTGSATSTRWPWVPRAEIVCTALRTRSSGVRKSLISTTSSNRPASKVERALVLGLALADTFVEGGERVGLLGLTRSSATRGIVERLAQALVNDRAGLTTLEVWARLEAKPMEAERSIQIQMLWAASHSRSRT
jgi:hypothetical protein